MLFKTAKVLSTVLIFLSLFLMGTKFTEYQFMSEESLLGPVIILSTILTYHLFFDREINRTIPLFLVAFTSILFFVYYGTNTNEKFPVNTEYVIHISVILLLFLSIIFFKNTIINYNSWIIFVFIYTNSLYLPAILSRGSFVAGNSNGILIFLLLFFCLISFKVKNRVYRIVNIYNFFFLCYALFIATSRTAVMAFFIVALTFFLIKYLHKYIFIIITSIVILSPLITVTYINLKTTPLGLTLNNLSLKYTGKNFFSGRDRIWKEAIDSVYYHENIWQGLGNNVVYRLIGGYLHNLYIQLFFQSGFLGILLILLLFISIGYLISKTPVIDYEFKLLSSFFVGILFLQIFEGHLIYKFDIITIMCWIIIALLINKSVRKDTNISTNFT